MDPKQRSRVSKLFTMSPAELKDDDDKKFETSFDFMQSRLNGLAEKDALNTLISMVSQENKLPEITFGLLYGILTDSAHANKYMRELTQITNDGWNACLSQINYLMIEKYSKMLDSSRQQLLWLLREAVRNQVPLMDKVMLHALRLIQGGDISPDNLRLADMILNIFLENEAWLMNLQKNYLVPCAVYTYLRMIVDHSQPSLLSLREKEVKFCAKLLRERFQACLAIGRDLARLLIMVAKIPEFNEIWTDILHNPTKLFPNFGGVDELLCSRGNCKWFLSQRLSVDVERKVCFMLKHIPYGNHERHIQWFIKAHLSTPQCHTLRADLIRFICVCGEDSSAKEGLPRWQLLNAILPTNMPAVESQMCKLALCWDWLFYDSSNPPLTVPAIEPVYSLMLNCLKTQSATSTTLLDYLARASVELLPASTNKIKSSLVAGFKALLDNGIMQSYSALLESSRLDKKMILIMKEKFPELYQQDSDPVHIDESSFDDEHNSMGSFSDEDDTEDILNSVTKSMDKAAKVDPATLQNVIKVEPTQKIQPKIEEVKPVRSKKCPSPELPDPGLVSPPELPPGTAKTRAVMDIEKVLPNLDERFRKLVTDIQESRNNESACNSMQSLLIEIVREDNGLTQEDSENIAECLCSILEPFFVSHPSLPNNFSDEEAYHEALQKPLFVIFRVAQHYTDDEGTAVFDLLTEMQIRQRRMGYLFLYFLRCPNEGVSGKDRVYENFAEAREISVEGALIEDLKICEELDQRLFSVVVRFVYTTLPTVVTASQKLLHCVVSCFDALQLAEFLGDIFEEKIVIFKKDTMLNFLVASLKWSTLEQYWFWQMVAAQDISFEWMLSFVPKLEWPKHSEAMNNVLLVIRRLEKDPTTPMLRAVLARDPSNAEDLFSLRALKLLIDYDADKVSEVVNSLVPKLLDPGKSKKGQKGWFGITNLLGHLDSLRRHCFEQRSRNNVYAFFTKDTLHQALRMVQRVSESGVKGQFSEFFAAMEILDSARNRDKPSRRATLKANKHKNEGDTSEEEVKPKKKRSRVAESESD